MNSSPASNSVCGCGRSDAEAVPIRVNFPRGVAGSRNHGVMSRRPNESAAQWYERAIVTNSVAATQHETVSEGSTASPAARNAIAQRASEAAADVKLAAAAFRAEREAADPS